MSDFYRQLEEARRRRSEMLQSGQEEASPTSFLDQLRQRQQQQGIDQTLPSTLAQARPSRPGIPSALRNVAGGAVRGLASTLEPLQLPQDILFGAVAGALDERSTIGDRLRGIEWGRYAPWGEAPARVASGQEIFELSGMDPRSAKWAGIGADLIVDPLVFGSFLRVGGKVANVDELVTWGDRFDNILSPIGVGRAAGRIPISRSERLSDFVDSRMEVLVNAVRNPESRLLGIDNFGSHFQTAASLLLPQGTSLRLKFGREVARDIYNRRALGRVAGSRLQESANQELQDSLVRLAALGDEQTAREFLETASGYGRAFEEHIETLPTVLRDVVEKEVYDLNREGGLLVAFGEATSIRDKTVREAFEEVTAAFDVRKSSTEYRGIRGRIADQMERAEKNINAAIDAAGLKVDKNKVWNAFIDYHRAVTEIDAKLGYVVSGFDFVKRTFGKRVIGIAGPEAAAEMWQEVLALGVQGKLNLNAATRLRPRNLMEQPSPERVAKVQEQRRVRREVLAEQQELLGLTPGKYDARTFKGMVTKAYNRARAAWDDSMELRSTLRADQRVIYQEVQEALDDYVRHLGDLRDLQSRLDNLPKNRMIPQHYFTDGLERVNEARRVFDERVARWRQSATDNAATRGTDQAALQRVMDKLDETIRKVHDSQFHTGVSAERVAAARQAAKEAADAVEIPPVKNNPNVEEMVEERLRKGMSMDEAMNRPFTWGELMDNTIALNALDLRAYLRNLQEGHMRRAFGLFQDVDDFDRYKKSVLAGKLIPNAIIDEKKFADLMPGFTDEARMLQQYHALLANRGRGTILRQANMLRFMTENGVQPERARQAMKTLIRNLHGDDHNMQRYLDTLDAVQSQHRVVLKESARNRPGSRAAYTAAQEGLEPETLEALGEMARASYSIFESSDAARRVMNRQSALQDIYQIAVDRDMIKATRFTDRNGVEYQRMRHHGGMLTPFSEKYMHPYLIRELDNAMKAPDTIRFPALQRLRALVTGGFLAAPNVLFANFVGGVYQSATAGMNPVVAIRRFGEAIRDLERHNARESVEDVETLMKRIDLNTSGMAYENVHRFFQDDRLAQIGIGREGIGAWADDWARKWENFLQAPGFGPVRSKYLGLGGFQLIENGFKLGAFKEMREVFYKRYLRDTKAINAARVGDETVEQTARRIADDDAAEFARTVVFDYSELPGTLDAAKRTGLVLFPGFTYFLAGRTLSAALKRPGTLAVADRVDEALGNALLDEDDRFILHASMPEWLRNEQGAPIIRWMDEAGDLMTSVIPMNQLIPTGTIWDTLGTGNFVRGNPWGESLLNGGVWGPLVDLGRAWMTGSGEATLSGRFGQQVWAEHHDDATDKFWGATRFLFNNLAPAAVRKAFRFDMNDMGNHDGVLPAAYRKLVPRELADTLYDFEEQRRLRSTRGLKDEIIAAFIRSPQVIPLSGPLNGLFQEYDNALREHNTQMGAMRTQMELLHSQGFPERAAEMEQEMAENLRKFEEEWAPVLTFYEEWKDRNAE